MLDGGEDLCQHKWENVTASEGREEAETRKAW
jgi:hypothetical protein